MRSPIEHVPFLALVAPALALLGGCVAPSDSPEPAPREDVAPTFITHPRPTPTFYRATPSQAIDLGPETGRYCTLTGVAGEGLAQVVVVSGRFRLQTEYASYAWAECVAWNEFNGANATNPESNVETPYDARVLAGVGPVREVATSLYPVAGSACFLSGVAGSWAGPNKTNALSILAGNAFTLTAATDGPIVEGWATCIQFLDRAPLLTTTYHVVPTAPHDAPTGAVGLPNAKTALCGIQGFAGHLSNVGDVVNIYVDDDLNQTAYIGGAVQSADVRCVSFAQN